MSSRASRSQEFVFLNVGGQSFKLLSSTVQRYPESLLAKMVAEFPDMVEKEEEIYIDRSPKYFEWILEVYRSLSLIQGIVKI